MREPPWMHSVNNTNYWKERLDKERQMHDERGSDYMKHIEQLELYIQQLEQQNKDISLMCKDCKYRTGKNE